MMWRVLLLPLLLLSLSSAAQPKHYAWPRNARTDSVEFRGVLPWPSDTLTEAERQALVQRWYYTRLNETQKVRITKWPLPEARTYAGLPAGAHQDLQLMEEACRLEYRVELRPTPAGLMYRLWEFYFSRVGFDASGTAGLEQYLAAVPGPRPELDRMQHRLRVALAHW
jgi:hypothetical protein